ncbi:hypothetical protein ACIBCM_06650 [Streptomyces sp. NPDC051018]|uniref:hypothetical protein n=1 Tax=Streptomyces sp. NPDC051018 TaxID=3365639 RepID=UPI00378C2D84
MSEQSRRHVLGAAALTGAAVALPAGPAAARAGRPRDAIRVTPEDARYGHLVSRGANRFRGTPDEVLLATSAAQVVQAVQDAVRRGRRLAVRSGGHCFEDFVDHPEVRTVIDLSAMRDVYYDPPSYPRCCISSEAACTMRSLVPSSVAGVMRPACWIQVHYRVADRTPPPSASFLLERSI